MSRSSLSGAVVVLTGGARGIGRATAERLARAGCRVAVGDLDGELAAEAARELATFGGARHLGGTLDVADAASWRDFAALAADLGPVDVLVNNAGIMPLGPALEESEDVARAILDVNLHGVIHGTKTLAPGMVQRGHGHVVNVASAVGRIAAAHGATYSASKHAVVGYSEATRLELAPHGVHVSLVMPTVVRTELADGVPAAQGLKPVSAADVAEVIESVLRRPRPETWVPPWSQALVRGSDLLPRPLREGLARMMKADSLLADADPSARAAYEERIRRS